VKAKLKPSGFNFVLIKEMYDNDFVAGTGLCGTVLKDHPEVLKQSQKYYTLTHEDQMFKNIKLPDIFNGYETWQNIITYDYGQLGPADWAYISKEMFLIRFNLSAYKVILVPDVNVEEILLRIERPPLKPDQSAPSSLFVGQPESIFQGYSNYDTLEYAYVYGFTQTYCYNYLDVSKVVDMTKLKTMEDKAKVIADNSELFDRSHCITKVGDKFISRRIFRTLGIANVGLGTDESLKNDIIAIKSEIYRFGPVIAGFLMYDDFKNSYDGKTIYTGPKQENKPIGGHSVGIMGWGTDEKMGDYWILSGSWDLDWGLLGTFKMKMGIKECMLEKNVITFMVDLPNSVVGIDKMKIGDADPQLGSKRSDFGQVNPQTFFTDKTTEDINKGILVERSGKSVVSKLIENPGRLVVRDTFFAANVDLQSYLQNVKHPPVFSPPSNESDNVIQYFTLLVSIVVLTIIANKMSN
jgi:hypothetical protein